MIIEDSDPSGRRRFVIRPNRSLSWRGNLTVIMVLGVLMGTVAAGFAWRGAWPVLPFAGLELAALAAGLYWVARRLSYREVVTIGPEEVVVEQGRRRPQRRSVFPRAWVRVMLERPSHGLHPARLALRCHGRAIEIGALLTDEERERLAARLRAAIAAPGPRAPDHLHPTGGDRAT